MNSTFNEYVGDYSDPTANLVMAYLYLVIVTLLGLIVYKFIQSLRK